MSGEEFRYLELLNEPQREAVTAQGEPLLVLAGAGSGKTRVITHKIAYSIDALGYDPRSVLAVTFTNKAAEEMRERVAHMTDHERSSQVMIRTFHSFGAWVLRRFGQRIGLRDGFTIYDEDDSLALLHSLFPNYKRTDLSPYCKAISRAKDRCITEDDDLDSIVPGKQFAEMYRSYQKRLREIGNVDFGDLIIRVIELFRKDPQALDVLKHRFCVILVDEYQDTNLAQLELLRMLHRPGTLLCVVGDDDQSIYRFRGAEVRNILRFPDHFPGTRIIRLEENYRSTGRILHIASTVVANNTGRHEKTLWTRNRKGAKAVLAFADDHSAEAAYCASLVRSWGTGDGAAVLYRTNAQSAAFETLFARMGIPYKIVGALRFFEREEVKDALALLSLAVNPADEVAFRRIINKPARGIGKTTLERIFSYREAQGREVVTALQEMHAHTKGKATSGIEEFLALYDEARTCMAEYEDLSHYIERVLNRSGLLDYYRKQDETAFTQKTANLEEFVNSASGYPADWEGLGSFLEVMELDRSRVGRDDPAAKPGVTLITMHNTKGLEFKRVVITGLEEGLFPGKPRESEDEIEEERRIFYVSITRAQEELYMTSCRRRLLWGSYTNQMPSRFLREIPLDAVTIIGGSAQDIHTPSFGQVMPFPASRRKRGAVRADWGRRIEQPIVQAGHAEEELCTFAPGDAVYHESYGTGWVAASWREHGREIVTVQFENGRQAKFLPAYSPLEKVARD